MTVLSYFRRTRSAASTQLIIALVGLTVLVTPCATPAFASDSADVVVSGIHDDCPRAHATQSVQGTSCCCDQLGVLPGQSPEVPQALAWFPAPFDARIAQAATAGYLRNAWAVLKPGSPPPVYLATQRFRI
jgi:hypothetical protein